MSGGNAAWSSFWAAGGAGPESGCLPHALKGIDAAQRRVWEDTARTLPKGAKVLDLATGDGAVLGKLRRARADLRLVGVDSSPVLPRAPKGMTLRTGVAMEALPFAEGSFDQVTSQFGFEYGDTVRTAREIARVLKPGGKLTLILHHAQGPILAHNLTRASRLDWALNQSHLLARARALVAARRLARLPTPALFKSAPAEARARFGPGSVGEEFVTAILQTLELGANSPPEESLEVLQTLQNRAGNELARISALSRAACDRARIDELTAQLTAAELTMTRPGLLHEIGPEPAFAWLLGGVRN